MRGGVTAGHEISYNRFARPETILDADGEPANEQETIRVVEENWFERLNSVGYKAALCLVRGEENVSLSGYAQVKNALVKGSTSNYVVRYEDSDPQAEITWSNNRFYGRFKNNRFGLTALKVRPDVGNAAAEMDAIEQAAGTSRE
ncbi:hypothetical protein B5E60_11330 [Alistipes sp. An116]|nr:hypothetical protein B5E60_11330 [Alistipes sp. An116]